MKFKTIIATFLILSSLHKIQAQKDPTFQRTGFVFGASFGIANTSLNFPDQSYQHTDFGLDFKIGYMIKSDIAILLTSNVSIYDYSGFGRDRQRDFGVFAPTIQYWLYHNLWVQGGVGIGGDNPVFWDIKNPDEDDLETKYYSGLGVLTSVGYEIFQLKNNFTLDIKFRSMYRRVKMQEGQTTGFSYGILLGFNFY